VQQGTMKHSKEQLDTDVVSKGAKSPAASARLLATHGQHQVGPMLRGLLQPRSTLPCHQWLRRCIHRFTSDESSTVCPSLKPSLEVGEREQCGEIRSLQERLAQVSAVQLGSARSPRNIMTTSLHDCVHASAVDQGIR